MRTVARRAQARRRARRTARSRGKPRIAAAACRGAGVGGERQRRRAEARDAQDGDVVARVEGDGARRRAAGPSPRSCDRRVVLAGDDVGVGHDDAGRRDPARALDAEPARGAQERARRCRAAARTCGSRAIGGPRRRHVGLRAVDARQRVEARERVEDRPDGGSASLSARRIDERWTSSRHVARGRASAARRRPPARRARARRRRASAAPPTPSATPSPGASRSRRRSPCPSVSRTERQDQAARPVAPSSAEQRRVGRLRAVRDSSAGRAGRRGTRRPRSRPAWPRPTTKPCEKPAATRGAVRATMIQSRVVTRRTRLPTGVRRRRGAAWPRPGGYAHASVRGQTTGPESRRPPARGRPPARSYTRRRAGRTRRSPSARCACRLRRRPRRRRAAQARRARPSPRRFAAAWTRGDYAAMYSQLTAGRPQDATAAARFAARLHRRRADRDHDAAGRPGAARKQGDRYRVPVDGAHPRVRRRSAAPSSCPVGDDAASTGAPTSSSPGLRQGERSARTHADAAARRRCCARDGTVLAQGDARTLAAARRGRGGRRPARRHPARAAPTSCERLGVPAGRARSASAGSSASSTTRLIGRPGGELLAGRRVLDGRRRRKQGADVRTTISIPRRAGRRRRAGRAPRRRRRARPAHGRDPGVRRDRVLRPAAARARRSRSSPLTGALEAGLAKPVAHVSRSQTKATLEGVELENANGESCGGTLVELLRGVVQLGLRAARRAARRASAWSTRPSASASTSPPASRARPRARSRRPREIGDDLARRLVGDRPGPRAGHGAADGASRRRRSACAAGARALTLDLATARAACGPRGRPRPRVARTMRAPDARRRPVRHGHERGDPGRARSPARPAPPSCKSTKRCEPDPTNPESCPPDQQASDPTDTDAWFAAYAPAGTGRPRTAVGVLLVGAGAGGDTAAPVAQSVLRPR